MNNFWDELKRRNVIRETLGYLAVAWVLLQVADIVLETFDAPDWVSQTLVIILAIGLPVWVLISWAYKITLKGFERVSGPSEETSSFSSRKNLLLMFAFAVVMAVVLVYAFRGIGFNLRKNAVYRVVVLPLRDISQDKDNETFCYGLASSIHGKISGVKNLETLAFNSSNHFMDSNKRTREIAEELKADYILEGEVIRFEDNPNLMLISVNLVDEDERVIWSERYEENAENHGKITETVSKEIVDQLDVYISKEETGYIEKTGTNNLEAWKQFIKGKQIIEEDHWLPKYQEATDYFKEAIRLDPFYADAYAHLAYCQEYEYVHTWENKALLDLAYKNGEKALRLDSTSVRAHNFFGNYYHFPGKNQAIKKSEYHYQKALSIEPNDLLTNWDYAWTLSASWPQDLNKSLKLINKAREIAPYSNKVQWLRPRILFRFKDPELIEELTKEEILLGADTTGLWYLHRKGDIEALRQGNMGKKLEIFLKASEIDTLNNWLYSSIAIMYDEFYNDDQKMVEYLQKAYEIDKGHLFHLLSALNEAGQFERSLELMQTPEFRYGRNHFHRSLRWFFYHYYQNSYETALNIVQDSIGNTAEGRYMKCLALAGLGRVDEVHDILNNFWGEGELIRIPELVTVYAVLGERDSMYHYLNHPEAYLRLNSRSMLDPYRTEPRYREWLRKNYLPQPEETPPVLNN
ncbi:hypothetical protein [Robiginitalea sp. IMCC43444]|uniref:hypothetical protein n=1 Tax=Robiginitalea sp. IMCC43444 TaxID=3459121 RepID=UPI0040414AF7